ncbi:MAG: O-antigen ligase family protein, partial [Pseudomonadota bacterium]|nr:O-antigen ligase family protein [Pseudomonadota bacterium]
ESARARVILWHETASRYMESPILGIGVRSTKVQFQSRDTNAVVPEGYPYPLTTGRHAHNIYLQTWFELGAVGAFLLLVAGLSTIWSVARLPVTAQASALATFASAATMASTSYGLWQGWFIALNAMAAFLVVVGSRFRESRNERDERAA